jgi:lipopolysaccharide/colanic/teichoic acid biosynthesis glycosyltransferase
VTHANMTTDLLMLAPVIGAGLAKFGIAKAMRGDALQRRLSDVLRRCLDIAVSVISLITLGPLMALVALAIKADSPGTAVFKQVRVGKNGVPFTMYKFRSMTTDAEATLDAVRDMSA